MSARVIRIRFVFPTDFWEPVESTKRSSGGPVMRSSGLVNGKYVSVFQRTSIGMYVLLEPPFIVGGTYGVPSLINVRPFGASGFLNKGAPIGFFTGCLAPGGGGPEGGAKGGGATEGGATGGGATEGGAT